MAEEGDMLEALLQWLHSLCAEKVHSFDDPTSGVVLWQVLQTIDTEAFGGGLPSNFDGSVSSEPRTDVLSNLNHIYTALTTYIVDRCRRKLPLPSGEPDLEAIAQSSSEKDVTQLLKLVFLAAIFGRFSMDYIQQLTSFSSEAQAQFYLILEEPVAIEEPQKAPSLQSEKSTISEDEKDKASPEEVGKDPELVYEERIAGLVASNKRLEHQTIELSEQLENLHDLHTKLQKSYDSLEIQQQDTAERLQALRSGKGEQNMLSIQRTKMQQQEDVIATLESQVSSLQGENNDLKIQTESLQSQTEGFQQMKDDVYELKLEREQLWGKANAADKYKQKLQSLQKVEDNNEALKYRVTELQRQLKQCDSDQFASSDLRRENGEYQRLVSNIERELSDSIEAKKRAEFEKVTLEAKLRQADGNATRLLAKADELQALLNARAGTESPTTPRATTADGLDFAAARNEDQQEFKISEGMSEMAVDDQNMVTENELQAIISIMKAHNQRTSNAAKTSSIQGQQERAAVVENSRVTAKDVKQLIEKQAEIIASLEEQLATASSPSLATSDAPQPAAPIPAQPKANCESDGRLEEALSQKANLERELQLMASAWYDQNSRLLSNTVGVHTSRSRPPPEPRSFLGRQRRLVDGVLTGRC